MALPFGEDFFTYALGRAGNTLQDFIRGHASRFDTWQPDATTPASPAAPTPSPSPLYARDPLTMLAWSRPGGVTPRAPVRTPAPTPAPTPTPATTPTPTPQAAAAPTATPVATPSAAPALPDTSAADIQEPTQDPAKSQVLAAGQTQLGKRYAGPIIGEPDSARWGDPGWDCSSFVSGMYRKIGVNLTPYTDTMARQTTAIDPSQAQPGDLVFFSGYNDGQAAFYKHVGLYMGNGQMIDASFRRGVTARAIAPVQQDLGANVEFRRVVL